MIQIENRYRVLVKVPHGVDVEAYTEKLWERSNEIEDLERFPCLSGVEVVIYPMRDLTPDQAVNLDKLAQVVAEEMGFSLMRVE